MEEPLYGIEIQKEGDIYLGRMYSDGGSVKEFKSHKIDLLFRDMIYDMRLALGEFSSKDVEKIEDVIKKHEGNRRRNLEDAESYSIN